MKLGLIKKNNGTKRNQNMNLIQIDHEGSRFGVDTAIQCRLYYSLRSHQADLPKPHPSSPPQDSKARYLCTKSSIIRHNGRQADIYIKIIIDMQN